ncbi:MAG: BppU family phage baseplate upper protein [Candidatus Schmidhempelia sp.]|nr:BppU family phage baseplate upper protein [Candidatus Schmidhempelia sp.]
MSLSEITLATNKSNYLPGDDRREIRQDEKGLILPVHVLDAETDYDLTGMDLQFNERKQGAKFVIDNGNGPDSGTFEIVDAKSGKFKYTLQKQVYAGSGTCWFSIMKGNEIIDTTKDFYIDVDKAAVIHIDNDNYVSELEAQINNLKATVIRCQEKINQVIADNNGKVDAAIGNTQSKLNDLITKLTEYQSKYDKLADDWATELVAIQKDAADKQIIIKADAEKSFNEKIVAIQKDYDSWKGTTAADFQSKLDRLAGELKDAETDQNDLKAAIESAKDAVSKIQDVDFTKFAHKSDLENYYTKDEVYNKTEVNDKLAQAGQTKSVNGVKPDSTGNIAIKIPSDYVKSVNSQTPDSNGNVNVDTGGVRTINGKNGDVTMATFAPNLLTGTSEQGQSIPTNIITDIVHLTTDGSSKYTVAVDIDYSSFPSGKAGATLQVNNGGTVVESSRVLAGSKERVSVTFTTPDDCLWVTILLNSNSSYTGQYSCLKASRWQDNDTPPDMTWLPNASDNSGAIKDLQNKIIKMQTDIDNGSKIWQGTIDDYRKLSVYDDNIFYIIISKSDVVVK